MGYRARPLISQFIIVFMGWRSTMNTCPGRNVQRQLARAVRLLVAQNPLFWARRLGFHAR
jgi:hypothetical protein